MSEVNTTHALSCLQRVGQGCTCRLEKKPFLCVEHNRRYDHGEFCELCSEDAEMTGTKLDETAYCDGCAQHLSACVCLDPVAVMAATPMADSNCGKCGRPMSGSAGMEYCFRCARQSCIDASDEAIPVRAKVLQRGIDLTTGDRNKTYGPPEPNLTLQMELWTLYKAAAGDKHSMAHDAAMQHVFAKLARIASGPPLHEDNYVDLSTYSAIAYECDVEVLGAPSC